MVALRVECRPIGVSSPHYLGGTDNGGAGDTAVIEEHTIPRLHLVPEKVARLKIPNPVPMFSATRPVLQVIERKAGGFCLEKPVSSGTLNDTPPESGNTEQTTLSGKEMDKQAAPELRLEPG
jgi:hypothetical protein